jgi:hydroxymethylglutaryl-CoA synthase
VAPDPGGDVNEIHLTRLAVHRPSRRLSLEDVARAWGTAASGELLVAGPDEDAVTLAVAAGAALDGSLEDVSTVILVRPLTAHGSGDGAAVAAAALGLPAAVRTLQLAGSDRGVTTAISVAADLVRSGSDVSVLVLAGDDTRMPPGSIGEQRHGHGGAAVLISRVPGAARLCSTAAVSSAAADRWFSEDGTRQDAGERFVATTVLPPLLAALPTWPDEVPPASLQIALSDLRAATRLAVSRGGVRERVAAVAWQGGAPGATLPAALLVEAVAAGQPGELVEVLAVGSGVGQVRVEVRDPTLAVPARRQVGPELPYTAYLRAGGLLSPPYEAPAASPVTAWRDLDATLRLHGMRCTRCATVSYPRRPACPGCGSSGPTTPARLRGEAVVVTSTTDHLVSGVNPGTPESPTTMIVAETADGARLYLPAVHGSAPPIGSRVRTVLRLAHLGGGFRSYYWRFAPVGDEEDAP